MKRRYQNGIFLVILTCLIVLFILPSSQASTLIVDDDWAGADHSTIQDAINASSDGDTIYVYNGTYDGNISVSKTVSLIGNGTADTFIDANGTGDGIIITVDWVNVTGFNVTGAGSVAGDSGIEIVAADNCTISGCIVSDKGHTGIYLWSSSNNNIANNNASLNTYGINLYSSNNNNIVNNTASSNTNNGISLESSRNNIIANNSASSCNDHGIYLTSSNNNTIWNNTANSNEQGIYLDESIYNFIENNTASSNTQNGIHLESSSNNNTVAGNTGRLNPWGIRLSRCNDNVVDDNIVDSNYYGGIRLYYSGNSSISNNNASSNSSYIGPFDSADGIHLYISSDNVVEGNNVSANSAYGIFVYQSSHNNITYNTANSNGESGILLDYTSSGNTIANNSACSNDVHGIHVDRICDSNIIENNTANSNARHGISVSQYSDSIIIRNNNASSNEYGIYLSTEDNIVDHNTASWNTKIGIYLDSSTGNTISDNNASSNRIAIRLWSSNDNTIANNSVCSNHRVGIQVGGSNDIIIGNNILIGNANYSIEPSYSIQLSESSYNTIVNNTAISDSIGIGTFNSHRNTIANNTVCSAKQNGFRLFSSAFNTIENNNASLNNGTGIYLTGSTNNLFYSNTVSSNGEYGIHLTWSANSNKIWKNIVCSNDQYGVFLDGWAFFYPVSNNIVDNEVNSNGGGMYFDPFSTNSMIKDNMVEHNADEGIYLNGSINNLISNNTVSSNAYGILLNSSSNNNLIMNNTVRSNNQYGIYMRDSGGIDYPMGNRIYYNNFISNNVSAYEFPLAINQWNLSYPHGGNHWNDYNGTDFFSGPDQDREGSDSYGDTPYVINGSGAEDQYPLTTPSGRPLSGNIVFSHSDGDYLEGVEVIEVTTTWNVSQVRLYVNGSQVGTDLSPPHIFVLDTTLLQEDATIELRADVVLSNGPIASASIRVHVNNEVLTGDFLNVDAIRSTYSPDDTASIIVDVTPAPSYDNLKLIVDYTDPNGTSKQVIEDELLVKPSYIVGLPVFSHAPLGTYNVTVNAYGYNGTALIWNSTNWTYFEVTKNGRADELQDIDDQLAFLNQTLLDLRTYVEGMNASQQGGLDDILDNLTTVIGKLDTINASIVDLDAMIAGMNSTLVGMMDGLSSDLDTVGASLTQQVDLLESNLTTLLAGVNASLSSEITDLLGVIRSDIAGMNASISSQISAIEIVENNTALQIWLSTVLGQLSANLTNANATLHQALDDLDQMTTNYYSDLDQKLDTVLADLMLMEQNLTLDLGSVNDSLVLLRQTLFDQHNMTKADILDELADVLDLLSSVDANVTATDPTAALMALESLVRDEQNLTREQVIENATAIEADIGTVMLDMTAQSATLQMDIATLSTLVQGLHNESLANITVVLSDMDSGFMAIDDNIAGIVTSIGNFQTDIEGRLDQINASLADISMIETILQHVESLDESMAQVEADLATGEDDREEIGGTTGLNTVLLVIAILLLLIVMINQMLGRPIISFGSKTPENSQTEPAKGSKPDKDEPDEDGSDE